MPTEEELQEKVAEVATRLDVPGVAVGVAMGPETHVAVHGVTNLDEPLVVDAGTLFQIGSTGKTYTTTAIMQLVEQGLVELDAPVRTYIPELRLKDEQVARDVTVLHLLNHTVGWDGDFFKDTGEGPDALDLFMQAMADLEQVTPLGSMVSYNNASLGLAGLVIERVTGEPYEEVVRRRVLQPLGLEHTTFDRELILSHRYANGHARAQDGSTKVAQLWEPGRYGLPQGSVISSDAADQLAWARFHMGDGTAPDGTRILTRASLERMQTETANCAGSALGDAVGVSWLLRDIGDTRVVGHGGATAGQLSAFEMIPERAFAMTSLTNCAPVGDAFNDEIMRWTFASYLGLDMRDPEPLDLSADALAAYVGTYDTIAVTYTLELTAEGLMMSWVEDPAALAELGEEPTDEPPEPIGILPGDGDRSIVTGGPAKGSRGYFTRNANGRINGIHVGGRYATRATN